MSNAFNWRGQPSVFAGDPKFAAGPSGKSKSQISQDVMERRKEEGTLPAQLGLVSRAERVKRQRIESAAK